MPACDQTDQLLYRSMTEQDLAAVSALHAAVFGPGRFARTAYRVREDHRPLSGLCQVAECNGGLVAAVTFTAITIGATGGALLLGPLAVRPDRANLGIGRALIANGMTAAATAGNRLVALVGDLSYYGKLGFRPAEPHSIVFPGPVDPARILVCELVDGALEIYSGPLRAAR